MLKLVVVNTKQDKTKPGGRFVKYHHTTKFDWTKYGLYKADDDPDYSENCLVIAFREGGMSDDKLQSVKLLVMSRIVPTCRLKEVCEIIEISIKLTSRRNYVSSRTEEFRDNIPIISYWTCRWTYFIIAKTNLTSHCLINCNGAKHNNRNMI